MIGFDFQLKCLSLRKHKKNMLAIKILRLLGFDVHPCRVGGNGEFGGRVAYFTASSLPIKYESGISSV